jgi:hypothetical protein
MSPRRRLVLLPILLSAMLAAPALAADENDPQTKLREALRNAILQVRQLEDERAVMQAKQAESDQQIADLKAQVDTLTQQLAGPATVKKDDFDRMQTAFEAKVAGQADQIGKLTDTLGKLKAAYDETATTARTKTAELATAAGERDALKKSETSCEAKNVELFKVGNQILDRLKGFSVRDAMEKFEPFVGTKRVELETLAQDIQDKLLDQKAMDQKEMDQKVTP